MNHFQPLIKTDTQSTLIGTSEFPFNQPSNKYEKDAVAKRVMQMSDSDTMQMQPMEEEEEEMMQAKTGGGYASSKIANQINSTKGNGRPLSSQTNHLMNNAFGANFSNVKIHTGSQSIQMNQQLGARAFTFGNDIYFNRGEYKPFVSEGKKLLAHELTHVVQQTKPIIQRAKRKKKKKKPASSIVKNLGSYGAKTRQNIQYDWNFNLQKDIKDIFKKGIIISVRTGYNVTFVVQGFPTNESWVENAMKALALYTFGFNKGYKDKVITNITTVQHLDLSKQRNPAAKNFKGPNANIRFTSTKFDSSKKGKTKVKNIQLLIEKLSDHKASKPTETAIKRRKRFASTYQIYNTAPPSNDPLNFTINSLTDSQYDMALKAMDELPVKILKSIKGIPIHGGITDHGLNGEAGEYINNRAAGKKIWTRKITIYKAFFKMTPDQRKSLMIHELGHAVDIRPNESKGGSGKTSASKSKKFKKAVKKDGGKKKGVSTYSKTSKVFSEYYAEAFSMYFNQPDTLKALRPNVYNYFKATFP